jgi:polyhydroxybutyrate depolymerase
MSLLPFVLVAVLGAESPRLAPGESTRTVCVDGRLRSYLVYVPKNYQEDRPIPVVFVFHGFGADAPKMARFCGMNTKAEEAAFVAVYPYGTGMGVFRAFNGGVLKGRIAEGMPNDVAFVTGILDDLQGAGKIDPKRVYAAGMSMGAMMCYRLAAELSERIAAIAAVAGTMAPGLQKPKRPVPVIHFHGTADDVVPLAGPPGGASDVLDFMSVDATVQFWAEANGCLSQPVVSRLPDRFEDGTRLTRRSYLTQDRDSRVVLYVIEGGGHTWPGQTPPPIILGRSTQEISANDLIWEFFQRHPLR